MGSTEVFSARKSTEAPTILVVDDEGAIRTLIEKMLQRSGYSTVVAANGDEALSVCERSSDSIHLLVTDVLMPGMNGFDLAVRVAEKWPTMKILFVSAFASDRSLRRQLGDRPLLEKPFTFDDLANKVRAALSHTVGNAAAT